MTSKPGWSAPAAEVASALERVSKALPTSSGVEVLRGVRISASAAGVILEATDMSLAFKEHLPIKRPRSGECIVLDAKKLLQGLKTLEGDVRFQAAEDEFSVSNGTTTRRYGLGEIKDYPATPFTQELTEGVLVELREFELTYETIHDAVGKDQSRPVLCGVHLELDTLTVRLTSTDSYRLGSDACAVREGSSIGSVLVNGQDLAKALRVLDGETIRIQQPGEGKAKRWLVLSSENRSAALRFIDGQFPDWRKLVPETWEGSVLLRRKEAIKAFRRMDKLNPGLVTSMAPSGQDGLIAEQSVDGRKAVESRLEVEFVGAPELMQPMGVNPHFFADALEAVGAETVRLHYINPLRPMLVTESEYGARMSYKGLPERFHLVMPVRLKG